MSKVKIEGNASGTGTFTIAAPNSSTDRTLTLPDEAGTVVTTASPSLGRRNLIINGAMQVWQRGTSITSAYAYNADRWHNRTGTTVTWSRSTTVPDGFVYSNECSAAGSIAQGVELQATGVAGQFYAGSTYTLSVWATVEPTAQVDFADNFAPANPAPWGSGAMTSTGETSNGFTRYTQTYTVPAINGTNTMVFVKLAFASAVKYTGVQLEVGSVATPFEHRSYGEELALCQRYYWKDFCPSSISVKPFIGTGHLSPVSTARAMVFVDAPVPLRVTPSITFSDVIVSDQYNFDSQVTSIDSIRPTNGNSTKIAFQTVNASNGTANQFIEFRGKNNVDAYAAFDAEL
jgi:hypothetical protein